MFGGLEPLPQRRFCLTFPQLCRHQRSAAHVHGRAFRIVIAHRLFCLGPEPIELCFFADHLSVGRPGGGHQQG
ncbi:MAG: hypothetical protein QM771_14270 [Nitrospira sp.]